jgi:putative toxin-antitoxin system antitoxin component (TIGR02293 family)
MTDVTFKTLKQAHAYIDDPSFAHLTDRPKAVFGVIDQLIEWLSQGANVSSDMVMRVLGIPPRTLARRKAEGLILEDETDRIVRFLRIKGEVERMFHGKSASAARWMTTPKRALGGVTPLAAVATERGALRVSNLIGQTMHGVVS